MENIIAVVVIVTALMPVLVGQSSATKRVILSPKSNLDTASISQGFETYCPNVVLTENEAKADYVLEASGDSNDSWHFALLNNDGAVLMTTHPERHFKHHLESVCTYINGK